MKKPVVDLGVCIYCGICAGISPSVFLLNDAGYVEVADLPEYPEEEVAEAVKYCPVDCIYPDKEDAAKAKV